MKRKYWKDFLLRGAVFGGLGCIVVAFVYLSIGNATHDTAMTTVDFFWATITGYVLAFVVAGASVFYQIEEWGLAKATLLHLAVLYAAYLGANLLNGWLSRDWLSVGIYTGIFLGIYLVIWGIVVASVTATAKKLNRKIAGR
jgi:hypothetical protein